MLLDVVCACKGLQDPLDLLCECMFVSFFDLYDQLWYMSSIYCFVFFSVEQLFLLQLSVSPDCISVRARGRRKGGGGVGGGGGGEEGRWIEAER